MSKKNAGMAGKIAKAQAKREKRAFDAHAGDDAMYMGFRTIRALLPRGMHRITTTDGESDFHPDTFFRGIREFILSLRLIFRLLRRVYFRHR